jgi:hypothetical protein
VVRKRLGKHRADVDSRELPAFWPRAWATLATAPGCSLTEASGAKMEIPVKRFLAGASSNRLRGFSHPAKGKRSLAFNLAAASLFLFLLISSLFLLAEQMSGLFRLSEVGYGDSYILYDVAHFQRTGEIYRDLSRPPYLPAQYSPLVYMLYALPKWNAAANPFFGPRLLAIGVFLSCVGLVVSLTRKLIPVRFAWLWGLLLATSIMLMAPWILQLRGDFPAILCGLAAMRLLLARPRYAVLLAGLCAGLALQFKLLYFAPLLAGSSWLLLQRRYRQCATFVAACVVTSAGLYFFFWAREPRMLSQMLAVSPGIRSLNGWTRLISLALETPLVLLTLPAVALLVSQASQRWKLLVLYALASFSIAALATLQAGANVNYYFEGLFALVPVAVFGVLKVLGWSRNNIGLALFMSGLILLQFLLPQVQENMSYSAISPAAVVSDNTAFRRATAALQGLHIFSTVPRLALLDSQPALMEPFLLTYLRRLGKFDIQPITRRLGDVEFDVVITSASQETWRGIPHVDPVLRESISASYKPYCTVLNSIIHVPRSGPQGVVLDRLRNLDCRPYPAAERIP